MFAAVYGETECYSAAELPLDYMQKILEKNPVKSAQAATRNEKDKEQIDAFVVEHIPGGFEELDRIVTENILATVQEAESMC